MRFKTFLTENKKDIIFKISRHIGFSEDETERFLNELLANPKIINLRELILEYHLSQKADLFFYILRMWELNCE
jgi:hypothetical protein